MATVAIARLKPRRDQVAESFFSSEYAFDGFMGHKLKLRQGRLSGPVRYVRWRLSWFFGGRNPHLRSVRKRD